MLQAHLIGKPIRCCWNNEISPNQGDEREPLWAGNKISPCLEQRDSAKLYPYLADLSAGIGTLRFARRLPGFIGPFPSTSPDKAILFSC